MKPIRIFISSVQKEFAEDRTGLRDYLRGDPLMRRFFDVFLFEDTPAKDRRADELYLEEVERCDIYVGLFGDSYGIETPAGLSPTHLEFRRATELNKHRLIFVKGAEDAGRHPKMAALIEEASGQVIRRRFVSLSELVTGVYASLVEYLGDKGLLRFGPFDASPCQEAALADLSEEKILWFLKRARAARGFPLDADAGIEAILTQLRLLNHGLPTHAAVLLFAREPQRFVYSSEVKCAHFHGATVRKPIPFYQVYKGNLFELVDQAVNFVLSKIDLAVGTRAKGPEAPVAYEIPPEVISEAIVNAVAHRDYTSTASVQVMLFSDRLEVWNPGTLPPALTLKSLREPHGSYPGNPLIAEPLYLTKYIERMGTGIHDMIERCREAGLPEPEFKLTDGFVTVIRRKPGKAFEAVGGKVAPEVGTKLALSRHQVEILYNCLEEQSIPDLMKLAGRTDRTKFRNQVLRPLLEDGLIEMTIPDKPTSSKQRYRLTEAGKQILNQDV
jgi:predicted HTH transcriptional regulator